MTQHHAVEPTGATAASGHRPELAADVDETIAVSIGQLGREGSGTDTGRVGLGDADDAVDVPRPEPGARARPAGGRVRRGDVRIGAMVEVEERRLGALEQEVGAVGQGVVQQADRVGDVGHQAGPEGVERADHLVDIEQLPRRRR